MRPNTVDEWRSHIRHHLIPRLGSVRLQQLTGAQLRACYRELLGSINGTGVYGATKSAVNAIATSLRQELENDTIRVVNVIPGPTATNLARHEPDTLRGVARIVGADSDLNFDAPLPATMLDRIAVAASSFLASADDVARAVMFAISQPIELNVFEVSVLPPRRAPSLR